MLDRGARRASCILRRYVFAGSGTVSADGETYKVKANSLVKSSAACDLVWTRDKGCDVLVVASSEYDSAGRLAARAAVPYVFGGLVLVFAAYAVLLG